MSDTITIYRVPEGACVPSVGQNPGYYVGPLPPGDYLESPQLARNPGRTCLVPRDYPGGLRFYWTDTHYVEPFAKRFIPEDHQGPEGDSCYLGLNFTDEQWGTVEGAMAQCPRGTPEEVLTAICNEWLMAPHKAEGRR